MSRLAVGEQTDMTHIWKHFVASHWQRQTPWRPCVVCIARENIRRKKFPLLSYDGVIGSDQEKYNKNPEDNNAKKVVWSKCAFFFSASFLQNLNLLKSNLFLRKSHCSIVCEFNLFFFRKYFLSPLTWSSIFCLYVFQSRRSFIKPFFLIPTWFR